MMVAECPLTPMTCRVSEYIHPPLVPSVSADSWRMRSLVPLTSPGRKLSLQHKLALRQLPWMGNRPRSTRRRYRGGACPLVRATVATDNTTSKITNYFFCFELQFIPRSVTIFRDFHKHTELLKSTSATSIYSSFGHLVYVPRGHRVIGKIKWDIYKPQMDTKI